MTKDTGQDWRGAGFVHTAVAHEIGARIVRGEFPPGTVLPNEAEWSSTFGVSRSVVREAIKMLAAKNLLSSRPKIGSRVAPRTHWNLLDRDVLAWYADAPDKAAFMHAVQEFRHIIEPEAAALAALRRSGQQMQAISDACRDMGIAPDPVERTAADRRFHIAILHAAGNELLVPLGALIDRALEQLFMHVTREVKNLHHAQDLHEAIEEAIRRQRPDDARLAARRLLANTDEIIGVVRPGHDF